MDQKEFLKQHMLEGKSYPEIIDKNSVKLKELQEWYLEGEALKNEIKKANQYFNSRVNNPQFTQR